MKKTKLFLGLLSICLLSSCQSNTLNVIQIESVAFADESIEMYIGEEKEINYNILPENATNKAVQFIITNNNVIKFENNKIIALASGESRLIIRSLNNKEDILLIKVKSKLDETNNNLEKYTLGLEYMKDNIYYENNIVAIFMEDKLKSEAYSLYQYKENKKGAILSMTIFSSSIDYGERIDIDDTELSL